LHQKKTKQVIGSPHKQAFLQPLIHELHKLLEF